MRSNLRINDNPQVTLLLVLCNLLCGVDFAHGERWLYEKEEIVRTNAGCNGYKGSAIYNCRDVIGTGHSFSAGAGALRISHAAVYPALKEYAQSAVKDYWRGFGTMMLAGNLETPLRHDARALKLVHQY